MSKETFGVAQFRLSQDRRRPTKENRFNLGHYLQGYFNMLGGYSQDTELTSGFRAFHDIPTLPVQNRRVSLDISLMNLALFEKTERYNTVLL